MNQQDKRNKQTHLPPEKLSYKLIKRRYKLTDENFSTWFNYASALTFRRSPVLYRYLTKMIELIYRRYVSEGKAPALERANKIIWPAESRKGRRQDYKDGLIMFITKIDHLERSGLARDPKPER